MITGNKIILREKRLADAWNDYTWETNPKLAYLDAAPVTTTTFSQYLSDFTNEFDNTLPTSYRFAVATLDGKHIGNCSYYNISQSKGETELGIMIGNHNYWDNSYGTDAVTTLVNYVFRQTDLKRIHLKTLESNTRAQKCFLKCGFTPYGHSTKDGFSFMLMEIYRNRWQESRTLKVTFPIEE